MDGRRPLFIDPPQFPCFDFVKYIAKFCSHIPCWQQLLSSCPITCSLLSANGVCMRAALVVRFSVIKPKKDGSFRKEE